MVDAVEFVKETVEEHRVTTQKAVAALARGERASWPGPSGPATSALVAHVLTEIEPLLSRQWLTIEWPRIKPDRERLVNILDDYDLFGIPKVGSGVWTSSRFLDAHEMALVSLLVGNRPSLSKPLREYTPAEVVKLETTYMRPLLKKHGRNGITDADRGPLAGTKPRPAEKEDEDEGEEVEK